MAFPWLVIPALYSAIKGGQAASEAGGQAQEMSAEQRALLQQILQWGQKYGEPALGKAYEWATTPYANAYERGLTERARQGIETGYRPAYGRAMQTASNRGMLNAYNSVLPRYTGMLERARGGDVAQMYLGEKASRQNELGNRLQAFMSMLSQARAGNVAGAGAYSSPIATFANLAAQGGASAGSGIGNFLLWLAMQGMGKGGAGELATSPYVGVAPPTGGVFTGWGQ